MRKITITEISLTLLLTSLLLPSLSSITTVKAQGGTIYIRSDGSVDPSTAPIQRNGNNYAFTDNIYETIVVQRNNITIDGNGYMLQGSGNGAGFELSNCNDVTIKKTDITEWNYGVHIHNQSASNTISDNNLTNNTQRGIFVSNSSSNTIRGNNITDNNGEGIFLWKTNTTTVTDNRVSNNGEDGISIALYSFNNIIISNAVYNNSQAGISLPFDNATDNVVTGNNITENAWAGIYIVWSSCTGNTFYHNNLHNNTNQVITVGAISIWNNSYLLGGNYWSNYNGTDSYCGPYQNETGTDGIGDTPYIIDAYNQDNYPFINPWTPQAYDVATVNVTTSKTVVGKDYPLHINVTITNQGSYTQTFNVTAYANTTVINTETVTLENGNSTKITLTWNTTNIPYGYYNITGYATPLPGETDTTDNTYTNGIVMVTIPGDVNGDRTVNMLDAGAVSANWHAHNVNEDINDDGTVDIRDAALVNSYWHRSW